MSKAGQYPSKNFFPRLQLFPLHHSDVSRSYVVASFLIYGSEEVKGSWRIQLSTKIEMHGFQLAACQRHSCALEMVARCVNR